jgi:hypothetical protein
VREHRGEPQQVHESQRLPASGHPLFLRYFAVDQWKLDVFQRGITGKKVKALKDESQGFPSKVSLLFAVQGIDLDPVYLIGPAGGGI